MIHQEVILYSADKANLKCTILNRKLGTRFANASILLLSIFDPINVLSISGCDVTFLNIFSELAQKGVTVNSIWLVFLLIKIFRTIEVLNLKNKIGAPQS